MYIHRCMQTRIISRMYCDTMSLLTSICMQKDIDMYVCIPIYKSWYSQCTAILPPVCMHARMMSNIRVTPNICTHDERRYIHVLMSNIRILSSIYIHEERYYIHVLMYTHTIVMSHIYCDSTTCVGTCISRVKYLYHVKYPYTYREI